MSATNIRRLLGSWLGIAMLGLLASTLLASFSGNTTQAASFDTLSTNDKTKAYYLYQGWQDCIDIGSMNKSIAQSDATNPGDWELHNRWVSVGYIVQPGDGHKGCDNVYIEGLKAFGLDGDKTGFLNGIGYVSTRVEPVPGQSAGGTFWKFEGCQVPVEGGIGSSSGTTNSGTDDAGLATCFRKYISSALGTPTLSTEMKILRNKATLDAVGVHFRKASTLTQDGWIDFVGSYPSQYGTYGSPILKITSVNVSNPTSPTVTRTPYYAGASFSLTSDKFDMGSTENGRVHNEATAKEILDELNALYGTYSDQVNRDIANGTFDAQEYQELNQGNDAPTGTNTTSCAIPGLGWILCPVINALASLADGAFSFISGSLLATSPETFSTSGTQNSTYTAWSVMRDFANVAFVIAFMVIIFSQLTNFGITNYGIKKMLPRLIIAAILVNLSFFVCQIAVDLSNILGYSVKDTLDTIGGRIIDVQNFNPADLNSWTTGQGGAGFAGSAVAILAVSGAVLWAGLAAFIPILLGAVAALITIFFILLTRQALIILLVVISPLAFVAFLLPNTQTWYKKWQKTFLTMLMLFPIISLVFGASNLAGDILSSTFSGPIEEGGGDWWGSVVGSAVATLPLFLVPGILKKSLDGVGGIGQKINNIGNKLRDSSRKAADPYVQQKKQERQAERAAGTRGMNPFSGGAFGRRDPNATNIRTTSQRFAQNRKTREAKIENLKSTAGNQWQRLANEGAPADASRGLRGLRRTARGAQGVRQEGGAVTKEKDALGERAKELLEARTNTAGTRENVAFQQKRTSEIGRTNSEKRAESTFMRGVNTERGVPFEAIQDTKLAETALKASEATQEGVFKVRQAASIGEGNEMDQVRQEQVRAEETTATGEAAVKAANKGMVETDDAMQALRDVRSYAEDREALSEQNISTRLEERVANENATPEAQEQAEVRQLTTAAKQAQQTAQESLQKDYGKAVLDRTSDVHTAAVGSLEEAQAHGQLRAEAYGQQVVSANRKKVVDATKELTTSAAAAAVQAGVRRNAAGDLYIDTGGVPITDPVAVRQRLEDYGAIAFRGSLESFTEGDRSSLSLAQDYTHSAEGAEALVTKLAESKNLKIKGVKKIIESAPVNDRPVIVAAFNAAARSAGLDYAASNSVDAAGDFVFYGSGGENTEALAKSLIAKGLTNIPTPALFDDTVRTDLTPKLSDALASVGEEGPAFDDLGYTLRDLTDDKLAALARAAKGPTTDPVTGQPIVGNYKLSAEELQQTSEYKKLLQLRRAGQQRGR